MSLFALMIFVILNCIINFNFGNTFRNKRDDGSYLGNSGGPVASGSQSQAGDNSTDHKQETKKSGLPCRINDTPKKSLPLRTRTRKVQQKQQDWVNRQQDSVLNFRSFNTNSFNTNSLNTNSLNTNSLNTNSLNTNSFNTNSFNTNSFNTNSFNTDKIDQFAKTFSKNTDSWKAFNRTAIFQFNEDLISKLNAARKNPFAAKFEMTKFSGLDHEVFKKKLGGTLNGCETGQTVRATKRMKALVQTCPQLDWNEFGVVPEVREQKECGSCYAMSTSDLIASQTNVEKRLWNKKYSLSPQYILDCFKDPEALGCNGGRPKKVLDKIQSNPLTKIPLESCYPYEDAQGNCNLFSLCDKAPKTTVKYSELVDATGPDEKEVMASMLHWGPVLVIVGLSQAWQFYSGNGVLTVDQCGEQGDHAVLLTGYNYTHEIPHYIIKNSWGTDWGDKGYAKIEAGKNACDIAKSVLLLCTQNCDSKSNVQQLAEKSNYPKCNVRK